MNVVMARSCLIAVLALGVCGREAIGGPDKSVKEAAEYFFKDYDFSSFGLSPDGSHISMIVPHRDDFALRTFNIATGKPHSAYGLSGESVHSYAWIDGDHLIASLGVWGLYGLGKYIADEDLKDFDLIGPKRSSSGFVGHDIAKTFLKVLDPLPTVPGMALLADYAGNGQFPDTFYFKEKNRVLRVAERNSGKDVDWVCDNKGNVRFVARMATPGDVQWYHRPDNDGEWTVFSEPGELQILDFDGSGRNVISVDDGVLRLLEVSTGEPVGKPVSNPVYSSYPSLLRDRGTDHVVGAVFYWDKPKVVYYDPDYNGIHDMIQKRFPGMTCVILGKAHGTSILVQVSSDVSPTTIYDLDYGPRKTLEMVMAKAPWIRPEDCQPMEPVSFLARDGEMVYAYLTRARGDSDQAAPTVMLVHGGPFVRDGWAFDREVQFLARLGYTVIQVNYRGSSGYRSEYSMQNVDARLLKVCEVSTTDVADATRWAIAEGIADPDRIAIMGGSFGGYAALAGAAFEPDLYKVAVGFAGVYDFDQELLSDYRGQGKIRDWLGEHMGDIKADPSLYESVSPVHFADQIRAQVLLVHGNADGVVDADQSKRMARALKKAGKPYVLKITNWGIHGHYREKNRIKYGILVGEFLRKNL